MCGGHLDFVLCSRFSAADDEQLSTTTSHHNHLSLQLNAIFVYVSYVGNVDVYHEGSCSHAKILLQLQSHLRPTPNNVYVCIFSKSFHSLTSNLHPTKSHPIILSDYKCTSHHFSTFLSQDWHATKTSLNRFSSSGGPRPTIYRARQFSVLQVLQVSRGQTETLDYLAMRAFRVERKPVEVGVLQGFLSHDYDKNHPTRATVHSLP